jgi:hypothetical protein
MENTYVWDEEIQKYFDRCAPIISADSVRQTRTAGTNSATFYPAKSDPDGIVPSKERELAAVLPTKCFPIIIPGNNSRGIPPFPKRLSSLPFLHTIVRRQRESVLIILVKGILPTGYSGSCSPHPQATVAIARSLSRITWTKSDRRTQTKRLERACVPWFHNRVCPYAGRCRPRRRSLYAEQFSLRSSEITDGEA